MKINSLYIASLEQYAGSLIVSMGMMELLKQRLGRVAFFRPIIQGKTDIDSDIHFIRTYFSLDIPYDQTYSYTVKEVESLVADNRTNEIIENLLSRFKSLQENYDFVLIEGLSRSCFSATIDFDLNLEIAKNFGSPFASILNGKNKTAQDVREEIRIEHEAITSEGCSHFATFANRLSTETHATLQQEAPHDGVPTYLLPEIPELDRPTVREIKSALECELLLGEEADLRRVVHQSKIAAMSVEHFLAHIEDGDLIIVPGDRADILIASYASLHSRTFPNIAGIVLTGGFQPNQEVHSLLEGFGKFPLPVLGSSRDTYTTAVEVDHVPAQITPQSERKIALAMGLFISHVDMDGIAEKLESATSSVVTPIMFEFSLFERARQDRKKIVLPESEDDRILRATEILLRRNVVDIVLLGNPDEIAHKSAQLGLDIAAAEIIDPHNSPLMDEFSQEFYELRKHKGLMLDAARDAMVHGNYFSTMMVHKGLADGMVSGAIHTTADTIRPGLQIIKTKPGISIVSSVFFMCLDTRVLVYGDCAVNQNPNAEQLAEIAISSADTAIAFGIDPKIAMLSYSTGSSGTGDDVEKVREAAKIAQERRPDLLIEGPIQYDAAIEPSVAIKKLPDSKVAGQATIFIFPDLNTGNNTYKAVQRSAKALAIGPVLQGLKKPVNDLSRGCLVPDIVNTVAITAIQAQGE